MILLAVLAAVTGGALDYDRIQKVEMLPQAIRGTWDSTDVICKDPNSDSRMIIGANWIAFYEANGILQISTQAGLTYTPESLATRFIMAGEGSTWNADFVFAWDEGKPNELYLVEAKTEESMSREAKRELQVRCDG